MIQTILKYLANFSNMEDRQFCDKITSMQPVLEGDVMTVAQQWEQKGAQQRDLEIAKNMLHKGYDEQEIIGLTGLDKQIIIKLKQDIKH